MSPRPKSVLERRTSRFSTVCAKNQVLKLNIDKVTVIRVTQITLPGAPRLYDQQRSANRSYGNVRLAKWKILVQMSISLLFKSYGKSLRQIF
jgi:hypothetical protein